MKAKLFIVLILSTLTSMCFSQVEFDSIPCEKFRDPKETIKKIFMLQKENKIPVDIQVNDECITLTYDKDINHHITGGTTTHTQHNTIYFRDIEKLRIVHDNSGRFEIRFYNKATKNKFIVFLYDKNYAIQGVCAINCMIRKQKANDMY